MSQSLDFLSQETWKLAKEEKRFAADTIYFSEKLFGKKITLNFA